MTKRFAFVLAGTGLLTAALIWGFAFVVVKDALDYVGAIYMVAIRFSIAAFALAPFLIKKIRRTSAAELRHGAVLGMVLFFAYGLQTVGCDYTTAGKNAFLTTTYVLLIPIMLWPLEKKLPRWHIFVAAVISLIGIGLLSLGQGDALYVINGGDALTLACGIFYAVHIILMEKHNGEGDDPLILSVIQFFVCAVCAWVAAPFYDGRFPAATLRLPRVITALLFLGLGSTLIGFVLTNVGLKFVPSSIAALIISFEAVFGVLFGAIILREPVTVRMFIGCTLIFFAVVFAQLRQSVNAV